MTWRCPIRKTFAMITRGTISQSSVEGGVAKPLLVSMTQAPQYRDCPLSLFVRQCRLTGFLKRWDIFMSFYVYLMESVFPLK